VGVLIGGKDIDRFHFGEEKNRDEEPDRLTPQLSIDDAVLKRIIRGLYYPVSPYEFSVIGADILGRVYEQFLGSAGESGAPPPKMRSPRLSW